MKPLNQSERSSLLVKFILLFLVTVAITVFAIFFDFKLPAKLNESQRAKLNAYNAFNRNQKKMIGMIDTLNAQIEQLGNTNKALNLEQVRIAKQIAFTSLDTAAGSLLGRLNTVFENYLDAKVKKIEGEAKVSELTSELKDMKDKHKEEIDLMDKKAQIEQLEAAKRP